MTTRDDVAAAGERWAARAQKVESADAVMLRELVANSGATEAAKADKMHIWSRSRYASRRAGCCLMHACVLPASQQHASPAGGHHCLVG